MPKKITKTTEQLTEEFFAVERAEYEKRVPAAFPWVTVKSLSDPADLPAFEDSPPAPPEVVVEDLPPVQSGPDD